MRTLRAVVWIVHHRATLPLQHAKAAGTPPTLPPDQPLPAEWFEGDEAHLHFIEEDHRWHIYRSGTTKILHLQLWSHEALVIGESFWVGSKPVALPLDDPAILARIEILAIKSR
jgi:hypothetical protein